MKSPHRLLALLVALVFVARAEAAVGSTNALAAGFNELGFDLLRRIVEANPKRNVLISPLSLGLTLALVEQGADAVAEKELRSILRITGLSREQIREEARKLRESLSKEAQIARLEKRVQEPAGRGPASQAQFKKHFQAELDEYRQRFQFEIAQSIWVDDGLTVQAPFLNAAMRDFGADIKLADLQSPKTSVEINEWVTAKTRGKITSMVSPISTADRMILLNAVYFRDKWASEFSTNNSRPDKFQGEAKTTKPVFMSQSFRAFYNASPSYQHVGLPYKDQRFVMDLLLPAKALGTVIKQITGEKFEQSTRFVGLAKLDLKLPRFEISGENGLTDNLKQLGLRRAFDPDSNSFPGIGDDLFVSRVGQKTYIKVDEKGSEAAAATLMSFTTSGIAEPESVIPITFDRPFLFTIRHQQSGVLLFLGVIWDLPNGKK